MTEIMYRIFASFLLWEGMDIGTRHVTITYTSLSCAGRQRNASKERVEQLKERINQKRHIFKNIGTVFNVESLAFRIIFIFEMILKLGRPVNESIIIVPTTGTKSDIYII